MKTIKLTLGKVAQVSDHRFNELNQYKWQALFNKWKWYAVRKEGWGLSLKTIYMHRQIMGVIDPKTEIDHKDNDGLNNQDNNLRTCTSSQNKHNRGKQKNNTSSYKCVDWKEERKKYRARIFVNGKSVFLGYFDSSIEAAHTYDIAAKKYFGEFAHLNFPEEK